MNNEDGSELDLEPKLVDESWLMSPSPVSSPSLSLSLLLLLMNRSRSFSLSTSASQYWFSTFSWTCFIRDCHLAASNLLNQFLNFSQCKPLNRYYKTKELSNMFDTFCCSFLHVLYLDSRPSTLDLTHSGQLANWLLYGLSILQGILLFYFALSYTFAPSRSIGSISRRSACGFDNIPKIFLHALSGYAIPINHTYITV